MLDSTDSVVYFENILFYYKRRFFSKYTADDTHLYIEKFQIRYGESNFITYLKQKIKNDKTTYIFTSHNFKDVKTLGFQYLST